MTDLIKEVNASAGGVGCFPVSEFWLDIGSPIDYARAHESFAEISSHYE
jgi:NDP-sugar pyrophosphorylase family protein